MRRCCRRLVDRCGGLRLGLEFVRAFGCFGFAGGCTRWPCGLGGQEKACQERAHRGNPAREKAAHGEAAQECVGGRVQQSLAEGRVAVGGDLADGRVCGAEGLVRDCCDARPGTAAGMVAVSREA